MGKKNIIIMAIVGSLLVFLGSLILVINQIQTQNQEKETKENQLETYYKKFNELASQFADKRMEYTKVVVENMYYESVNDEYDNWIKEMKAYHELVDQILTAAKPLENLCINQVYTKEELKNDCDTYVINYETVMNYFVKDVNEFNDFIVDYNTNYGASISTYELDTNQYNYLDVNDDGKFIGKD